MLDDPILHNEWLAVAWSSEVSTQGPKSHRLLGRDLVLWRSAQGVHAWEDLCLHRGAKLSLGTVSKNCLICPYHHWEYDSSGKCIRIPTHPGQPPPTRARATVFQVQEKYGLIWICVGTPTHDLPSFPEAEDAEFRNVLAGPYMFEANGPRVIENFLDIAHLPFVHAGLLGDPLRPEIDDYQVESSPTGILARDIRVWQPDPDGTGIPAQVLYTYRVLRPLSACFTKSQGEQRFCMLDTVTPVDAGLSLAWVVLSFNYAKDLPAEELRRFQDRVSLQDKAIVESQRPELLPLDLQSELHLKSDRIAIAYRRWLKDLGLRYGTA